MHSSMPDDANVAGTMNLRFVRDKMQMYVCEL